MHQSQHGFIHGRSTLTSLLSFDNRIADILSKGHPHDIITIDFKKSFDKASHTAIFQTLANAGIADKTLAWFIRFFDKRTQQVKMGDCYFKIQHVIFGLVQGSSIVTVVFTVLIDYLLIDCLVNGICIGWLRSTCITRLFSSERGILFSLNHLSILSISICTSA